MSSNSVFKILVLLVALTALVAMACGTTATPVVIEKEVPVEVEIIKEVPVEVEKEVIREVIKEVPVVTEVVKEVVREVEVEVIKEVQVVREVEVPVVKIVVATPTPTPLPVPAAKLTRVPVFRVAYGVFSERIAPPEEPIAFTQVGQVYDPTVIRVIDETGVTVRFDPGLILEWDVRDGGKTVWMRVAEGVQAQEGWGEWTAEDATWMHSYFRPFKRFTEGRNWDKWDIQARQTGRYELEAFRGDGGVVPLVDYLYAHSRALLPLVKKHVESEGREGIANHPIGTGPFSFAKWAPGLMAMDTVPDHWRGIQPVMDRLEFFHVRESLTRSAMAITGKTQMTDSVLLEDALEAEKRGLKIISYGGFFNVRIVFGGLQALPHSDDPWADVKVRKAIALAIDKQAMLDEIWGGFATPLGTQFLSSTISLDPYPDDLVEAKRLLAEAGYPNGFDVEVPMVTIRATPRVPNEHNVLITSLENLGLKVKGTVRDWSTFKPRWDAADTAGMIFGFSVTAFPTPSREWGWYGFGARNNYIDEITEDLSLKLDAAYVPDQEEYKRLEVIAQNHLRDVYATVPLYNTPELHLLAPEFSWPFRTHPQYVRLEHLKYTP